MEASKKVVSLETARLLKTSGFPQDTERWWCDHKKYGELTTAFLTYDEHEVNSHCYGECLKLAAPDAQEIVEMLPPIIAKSNTYKLECVKTPIDWVVCYSPVSAVTDSIVFVRNKLEAEARAACWLWLKENKLI